MKAEEGAIIGAVVGLAAGYFGKPFIDQLLSGLFPTPTSRMTVSSPVRPIVTMNGNGGKLVYGTLNPYKTFYGNGSQGKPFFNVD